MRNVILALRRLLDPALEGDPFQNLPPKKQKNEFGIFSLRLRNRLSYRRY